MMHDDSEDKMFKALLAEYSAPVEDEGFAAALMQAHSETATTPGHNSQRLRVLTLGFAGAFGAAIAISKIPALGSYLSKLSLPNATLPDTSALNASIADSLSGSPYSLVASGLVVAMMVCIAGALMLSEDM